MKKIFLCLFLVCLLLTGCGHHNEKEVLKEFQNKVNAPENNIFMRKVQKTGSALDLSKIKELLEMILKEWAKDE